MPPTLWTFLESAANQVDDLRIKSGWQHTKVRVAHHHAGEDLRIIFGQCFGDLFRDFQRLPMQ
jgi:imidazoleglycerol phosphate dehydratase HisB